MRDGLDREPAEGRPRDFDGSQPATTAKVSSLTGRIAKHVLTGVLVAAALGLVAWYAAGPAAEPDGSEAVTLLAAPAGPAPRIGSPAPDFQIAGLDGSVVQLSSLRGKAVWIAFWASWCPPCRAESPALEAVYENHGDEGLVIVAVNVGESAGEARGYAGRAGLTFLVGLDPSTVVAANYRVRGIPAHFFVDAEGILRDTHLGPMSLEEMEAAVVSLMGARTVRQ